MSQSGPRDLNSVIASRYTLTAAGWAATDGHATAQFESADRPWWARDDQEDTDV